MDARPDSRLGQARRVCGASVIICTATRGPAGTLYLLGLLAGHKTGFLTPLAAQVYSLLLAVGGLSGVLLDTQRRARGKILKSNDS